MKRILAFGLAATAWTVGAAGYDWRQFNGDAAHSGNNVQESILDTSNVASLVRVFQVTLPSVSDGSLLAVQRIATPSGVRDVLFATTRAGDLLALDALTGASLWSVSKPAGACRINKGSSVCYTTSSPAVGPDRVFVYAYGLDGAVHRYRVGDGKEITGAGWPQTATVKAFDEKGSSDLTVAVNALGTPWLYVCNGGYPGDRGDYQGHVTAVNLSTGAQAVFNAACSDQAVHFVEKPGSPDCSHVQTAIWARGGAVYDAPTNRLFVATGNGDYDGNQAGHDWGDSVLAINPNGTGTGGNPIDAYTPANYQVLEDQDLDLGSTAPAILPAPGYTGRLGLQSGKDGMLRLLRLDDLSGHGGPGFTGGAVQTIGLPQGGALFSAPAVWVDPGGATWAFMGNSVGLSGVRLTASGATASISSIWTRSGSAFSPIVANGLLFAAGTGSVRALSPTTGSPLWSDTSSVGGIHWESPIVANGFLYLPDEAGHVTAWAPALFPVSLSVDGESVSGTSSDANGTLDPGETVELAPAWKNNGTATVSPTGALTAFTGPTGASYTIADSSASYGAIPAGGTGHCAGTTSGCYRVGISNPASRPAAHWDTVATETLSNGTVHSWTVHVGRSFDDVLPTHPFYAMIETLFHRGITAGCASGAYCPSDVVPRLQMAAFVARAVFGGDSAVPVAGAVPGLGAYACRTGGTSLFSDVTPTSGFCRQIHWLATAGYSFSCAEQASFGSQWCPNAPLTRGAFAAVLARNLAGSDEAVPAKVPDPGNGRGYDCTDGQANFFSDVGDASPMCKFVYYIWSQGIIDGLGNHTYDPAGSVTRGQLSKFLVRALGLMPD